MALKTGSGAVSGTNAFPLAGFQIESAEALKARKEEEELNLSNPELAAWRRIRKRLQAQDGETYFAESVKNSPLPKLKGRLIPLQPCNTAERHRAEHGQSGSRGSLPEARCSFYQ